MKKFKICVSGAAEDYGQEAEEIAKKIGTEIARRGHVIVTGATRGIPHLAARAAKKAGGASIGISPAASEAEHIGKYLLPGDQAFDYIIYTKAGYTGRNLLMVRSCDATIVINGRMGTLNEFTCAFEENEIVGVMENSGRIASEIRHILQVANKGMRKTFFENDPVRMLDEIIKRIKADKKAEKKFHLEFKNID
jgi:uncharacterized protein (TIGR00725 family)